MQSLEDVLKKNGCKEEDVIFMSDVEVMERLNVNQATARSILDLIYHKFCPKPSILEQSGFAQTGILALDQTLGGGIQIGNLTEIVGPAGVGKSQLCMTLVARAVERVLHNKESFSIWYIDTENKLSLKRLVEILMENVSGLKTNTELFNKVRSSIHIVKAASTQDIEDKIDTIIEGVSKASLHNELVVLDGVAALARIEFSIEQIYERQELIGRISQKLKRIANMCQIPVVVTNQVTASIGGNDSGDQNIAAMGLKWAHAVNTRLVMEHQGQCRLIKVAKSPISANLVIGYKILIQGVVQDQRICPYEQLDRVVDMNIKTVFNQS